MLKPRPIITSILCLLALPALVPGCTQDALTAGPLSAAPGQSADASAGVAEDAGEPAGSAWTVEVETPPADGNPRLYLRHAVDGQDLLVQVVIDGVDDLVGIAAHLRYDHEVLELVETDGDASFLDSLTYRSKLLLHSAPDGRLLLGAARLLPDPPLGGPIAGAKLLEDATWATLRFRARPDAPPVTAEGVEIAFDPAHLLARVSTYDRVPLALGRLQVVPPQDTGGTGGEGP